MAAFNADIVLSVVSTEAERAVKKLDRNLDKVERTTNDILAIDKKIIVEKKKLVNLSGQQEIESKKRLKSLALEKAELALQKRELNQIVRLERRRVSGITGAAQPVQTSSDGSATNAAAAASSVFAATNIRSAARSLVIQQQSVDLAKKKEGFRRDEIARLKGIVAAQTKAELIGEDRLKTLDRINDVTGRIAAKQKDIDKVNNSKNPDKSKNLFFGGVEGRTPKQAFNDAKLSVAGLTGELGKANKQLDEQNEQYDEARKAVTALEGAERRRSAKLQASLDESIKKRRKEARIEAQAESRRAQIRGAVTAVGAVGGLFAVAQATQFISQSFKLTAELESQRIRLKALSDGYDDYQLVLQATERAQGLFNQSQQEATAQFGTAYARLRPLGLTLEQVQAVYEGFNVAAINSGTTAAEASGAFTQLTQVIGAGALRGDELRSVLEQTPAIAKSIADELGITVGQLKDYGKEGLISSETVLKALVAVRNEGVSKLAKSLDTPNQKFKKLEIAGEAFRVALADEALPAVTEAVTNLATIITQLEGPIRFIGKLANQTLGGITDLINAATKPGEYAAAQSIKAGRLPFNVQATSDLFEGTGPQGRGLKGLQEQATELARLRNQPRNDVLLQLMQDRLEAIEKVKAAAIEPIAISTDLSGVLGNTEDKVTENPKIKDIKDILGEDWDKEVAIQTARDLLKITELQGQSLVDGNLKRFEQLELQKDNVRVLNEIAALENAIVKAQARLVEFEGNDNLLAKAKANIVDLQNEKLQRQLDLRIKLASAGNDALKNDLEAAQKFGELVQKLEPLKKEPTDLENTLNGIGSTIKNGLVDAISLAVTETDRLGDAFRDLAADILEAIGKALILASITAAIKALGGNDGVGLFSILAGSFGGGKAEGGPVSPSKTYITGEEGPELFIPGVSGTIMPADVFAATKEAMGGSVSSGGDAFAENEAVIATTTNYMKSQGESQVQEAVFASMTTSRDTIQFETYRVGEMDVVTREEAIKIGQQSAKQARAQVFSDMKNKPSTRRLVGLS